MAQLVQLEPETDELRTCSARRQPRISAHPISIALVVLLITATSTYAQDVGRQPMQWYVGLTHQHRDYFGLPFSFTGFEAGAFATPRLMVGLAGSSFLSPLEVLGGASPSYLQMQQIGLVLGLVSNKAAAFQYGMLLTSTYLSVRSSRARLSIFQQGEGVVQSGGLLLRPQVFMEVNVARWMRFRMGGSYDVPLVAGGGAVAGEDLRGFSIDFAFLFGRLRNTRSLLP